jgi:hypothetical protein
MKSHTHVDRNAGTVQEIFQDAAQNYYRAAKVDPTPMVLFGVDFWNGPVAFTKKNLAKRKPLYPLLRTLSLERDFLSAVVLTDDPEEIVSRIQQKPVTAEAPRLAQFWIATRLRSSGDQDTNMVSAGASGNVGS